MPFPDMGRVISTLGQHFCQGDLRGGHSHLLEGHRFHAVVHDRLTQALELPAQHGYDLGHAGRCGGEFEAKACSVAAREERGPGRCAGAVGRVPVGKIGAVRCDGVDSGRGYGSVCLAGFPRGRNRRVAQRAVVKTQFLLHRVIKGG